MTNIFNINYDFLTIGFYIRKEVLSFLLDETVQFSVLYKCTHSCPDTAPEEAPQHVCPKNNTDSLSNPIIEFICWNQSFNVAMGTHSKE